MLHFKNKYNFFRKCRSCFYLLHVSFNNCIPIHHMTVVKVRSPPFLVFLVACCLIIPPTAILKLHSLTNALVACWCRPVMAQAVTLRATLISLVHMHSGIVNGYQLLCDAHTVLEPHRGTVAFSFLLTIVLFHFYFLCVCHS